MGWLYGWNRRKDLIEELTKTKRNNLGEWRTLKRCYRGGDGSGVLWAVVRFEYRGTNKHEDYIICYMMHYNRGIMGGTWGYKNIEETMGPCSYSCPISYLQMVPMPDHPSAKNWRRKVAEYYWKYKRKKAKVLTS
jgi:hypothetical protein